MNRRTVCLASLPLLAAHAWGPAGATSGLAPAEVQRLATAWRVPNARTPDGGDRVGLLQVDWKAGEVTLLAEQAVPSRAHGLLAMPDGGLIAVANRPGRWLLRLDAKGAIVQRTVLGVVQGGENPARTLNGHVEASACGRWLFTSETDPATGAGWLSVRDPRTLLRVAQFESQGVDPHQLLRGPGGTLMVANGGIVRDRLGRKLLEPMTPSLVQLDERNGALLGRWTLPDPQLSLRHIAWADGETPRLGVGLQAEHDHPMARAAAPVLAVWEATSTGGCLTLQGTGSAARALAGGYVGDISAGPGGGFVLSAQKQGRALWWQPAQPESFTTVAEVTEPCGLLPLPDGHGVALSAGRGLARWHTQAPPRMLAWPGPLVPDNHWVALVG